MRWLAVIGQLTAAVVACWFYDVKVPWGPITAVFAVTIISNLLFPRRPHAVLQGWSLWLDVFLLTVLIYFTGGPHNPFTAFYLLHVALAAMTLSARNLWCLVLACISSYSLLFLTHRPVMLGDMEISSGCESYSWHLHGMLIAFIVTACFIASFVSRMHKILLEQDDALEQARVQAEKNARFASLATLSAGVAHELGSPLATISLASSELLRQWPAKIDAALRADAVLIQEQTQRCRLILDQLNERNTFGIGDPCLTVSATDLVQAVREKASPTLLARLMVRCDTGASWHVPLNSVAQAIITLLQNAEQADHSDATIQLHIRQHEGACQIDVIDAGPEPDAGILQQASDPFFTTKSPGEGMGLGLYLVQCLALRLRGQFTITRLPDGLTRASLLLQQPAFSETA